MMILIYNFNQMEEKKINLKKRKTQTLVTSGDSNQSVATPKWVVRFIHNSWGKNMFDPCPLNREPEFDGLKIDWKTKNYINPPYNDIGAW